MGDKYQRSMSRDEEYYYANDFGPRFRDNIAQPRSTDPAWDRLHPAVEDCRPPTVVGGVQVLRTSDLPEFGQRRLNPVDAVDCTSTGSSIGACRRRDGAEADRQGDHSEAGKTSHGYLPSSHTI